MYFFEKCGQIVLLHCFSKIVDYATNYLSEKVLCPVKKLMSNANHIPVYSLRV